MIIGSRLATRHCQSEGNVKLRLDGERKTNWDEVDTPADLGTGDIIAIMFALIECNWAKHKGTNLRGRTMH
jgi:hypothetical protein